MLRAPHLILVGALALTFALGCKTTPSVPVEHTGAEASQPAPAPAPKPTQAEVAPPATPAVEEREEPWRTQRPAPGAPSEPKIPKFQKATLKNGLTILVSERHELPIVGLSIAIKAGTAVEPPSKAGLADLTYELFLEGAGKLDALGLDKAFGELGATPRVGTGADGATVSTQPLTRNADAVLALMADLVLRPRFAQEDFDRNKKNQRASLVNAYSNPSFLASEAFATTIYGENHPYGHLGSGTPKSIDAITLDDVKAFYKKNVGPGTVAVVFTGDVTMDQAKKWAEKHFGSWKSTAKVMPAPPPPPTAPRKSVVLVPKPALPQTVVRMGRPGLPANTPDEAELELASSVFGGFFGSRLNMNLREDKGYTYGASAGASERRGVGTVTASSLVRADVTGPSVAEFMTELRNLKEKPITEAELNAAREGLVRAIPGSFETVGSLTGTVADRWFEDRQLDWYERYLKDLEAADAGDVQKVAEKYFDPAVMQIVLVGDPEIVQKQVGELKLGEFQIRNPPDTKTSPPPTAPRSK